MRSRSFKHNELWNETGWRPIKHLDSYDPGGLDKESGFYLNYSM